MWCLFFQYQKDEKIRIILKSFFKIYHIPSVKLFSIQEEKS